MSVVKAGRGGRVAKHIIYERYKYLVEENKVRGIDRQYWGAFQNI